MKSPYKFESALEIAWLCCLFCYMHASVMQISLRKIGKQGLMIYNVEIGPGTFSLNMSLNQDDTHGQRQHTRSDNRLGPCSLIVALPLDSWSQVVGLGSTNLTASPIFVCFVLVCITWELSHFLQSFLSIEWSSQCIVQDKVHFVFTRNYIILKTEIYIFSIF